MKISYNWLKWYIPDAPEADKLADLITYHLAEVETVEEHGDDKILDIKILPNRAHDLLSHMGVARELASLLNISYVDPTPKYKIPESKPTNLKIEVNSDKCRRYMGRVVRNVKVGPSPDWVVKHLESIGQRSINNMVDAANLVMFDCGQPTHVFDMDKVKEKIVVRPAVEGEKLITLDNRDLTLKSSDLIIADAEKALGVAGVKGGKSSEVDANTKNIIIEVANFDPTSVRKTAQSLNIFTDARKRFENDLSPELADYGMRELSALIAEMCPEAQFEEIVDIYPQKQEQKKLSFGLERISSVLGREVSKEEVEGVLKNYAIDYVIDGDIFEIKVPVYRLDLVIEEDMAEEIGRILGYDKVKPELPKINFTPRINEEYTKIKFFRNNLLEAGYNEVFTYSFDDRGHFEVLESASTKKFLRTHIDTGIAKSLSMNLYNSSLFGTEEEIKIFETGTVFNNEPESGVNNLELCVGITTKKRGKLDILEKELGEKLEKLAKECLFLDVQWPVDSNLVAHLFQKGNFVGAIRVNTFVSQNENIKITAPLGIIRVNLDKIKLDTKEYQFKEVEKTKINKFKMWPLFPFIARDMAVWVPENVSKEEVAKVIKDNAGELVVRGPEIFDEFKKEGKVSYAFRTVFQSYDRTLTDVEVNGFMDKVKTAVEGKGWQVR